MSFDLPSDPGPGPNLQGSTKASPSQGFDWDRDYDELLAKVSASSTRIGATTTTASVKPVRARLRASGIAIPIVLCSLLLSVLAVVEIGPTMLPTLARVEPAIGLRILPPSSVAVLPPQLQVYDHAQYQRFTQGLRRMSAKDLLGYETRLRHDLAAASMFMAPYHLDALFVLEAELVRRDLSPPR